MTETAITTGEFDPDLRRYSRQAIYEPPGWRGSVCSVVLGWCWLVVGRWGRCWRIRWCGRDAATRPG